MRYSLSILTRLLPKERLVKLPLHGLSHTAKRILAGTNTLVGSPSGSEWISTAGDQNINLRHFIKQDTVVDTFNIQYKTLPNVYCQRCGNLTCGEVKNIKQEYSTDQVNTLLSKMLHNPISELIFLYQHVWSQLPNNNKRIHVMLFSSN